MTSPIITKAKDTLAFEDGADRVRILVSGDQTGGLFGDGMDGRALAAGFSA